MLTEQIKHVRRGSNVNNQLCRTVNYISFAVYQQTNEQCKYSSTTVDRYSVVFYSIIYVANHIKNWFMPLFQKRRSKQTVKQAKEYCYT
jgi:hypothetical protein